MAACMPALHSVLAKLAQPSARSMVCIYSAEHILSSCSLGMVLPVSPLLLKFCYMKWDLAEPQESQCPRSHREALV